jgi:hypothetical protein
MGALFEHAGWKGLIYFVGLTVEVSVSNANILIPKQIPTFNHLNP